MKCFGPTLLEIGYYFWWFLFFFAPSYQLRLAVTSAVILRMMDVILFHLTHQNLATVTKHTTSTLLWFLECDILIEKISLSMFLFFLFTVLSALHRLQKSPNTFIPVHMHLGPRTRSSQVSLWNLPEELILYILKGLPIRDLLSMRAVSTQSNSSPCERKHLKILDNWNHCFMKNNFFVQVNSSFRDIIDSCSTLWNTASFQDVWPSSNNIQHFEKYVHITNKYFIRIANMKMKEILITVIVLWLIWLSLYFFVSL